MIRLVLRECPGCGCEVDYVTEEWESDPSRAAGGHYVDDAGRELFECPVCETELDD